MRDEVSGKKEYTQNQNESLNGMIWNRLPKSVFVGADVLQFGVMLLLTLILEQKLP